MITDKWSYGVKGGGSRSQEDPYSFSDLASDSWKNNSEKLYRKSHAIVDNFLELNLEKSPCRAFNKLPNSFFFLGKA